ncbi:hypothetical protein D5086_000735 [Populus alba]|uniref:Uncharacterized protein n=1 Tax=Populus alba TaxID=43335 RepID=A0ACC4CXT9_POPAL
MVPQNSRNCREGLLRRTEIQICSSSLLLLRICFSFSSSRFRGAVGGGQIGGRPAGGGELDLLAFGERGKRRGTALWFLWPLLRLTEASLSGVGGTAVSERGEIFCEVRLERGEAAGWETKEGTGEVVAEEGGSRGLINDVVFITHTHAVKRSSGFRTSCPIISLRALFHSQSWWCASFHHSITFICVSSSIASHVSKDDDMKVSFKYILVSPLPTGFTGAWAILE